MKVTALTLVVAVAVMRATFPEPPQPTRSELAVAFLYDLTPSATPMTRPLPEDRQLEDATQCVVSQLASGDTLRFGFITSRLYLSRPYAASEMTDFYRKVVRATVVSASDRIGPSPIWDAMDQTISLLASDNRRRAVIVMTDAMSTGNVHSVSDVVAHAKAAGVSISGIFAGNPFLQWKEWPVHPGETLTAMAAETGGLYVVPKGEGYREIRQRSPVSKRNLTKAVELIFENLRR